MIWRLRSIASLALLLGAVGMTACDGDEALPRVASIEVTSALDTLIPVESSTQLTATARDDQGNPLDVEFDWNSHAPGVATVEATGRAHAVGAGTARIDATVAATSLVDVSGATGSIDLQVLDADIAKMEALLDDPLVPHVVAALGAARTPVQEALAECDAGLAEGRLVSVVECFETVEAEAASATDATDRALLALLTVMTDFAESLLNL